MRRRVTDFYCNLVAFLFFTSRAALTRVPVSRLLVLAILVAYAQTAFAGTIDYTGPSTVPAFPGMTGWMGSTVWYAGVSESNSATESRFGAPVSISGNAIDFNPMNFEASSTGNASQITDSQLNFMVVGMSGNVIDNLQFSEAGDTTLFAFAPDNAFTSVTADIFVDVVALDGVPVGFPVNITGSMTFTPSGGDFQIGVDGSPSFNTIWSGSVLIDLESELALQGIDKGVDYSFGATKLNVAIDNTLTAASSGGGSAFIKKKDFDGLTVTSNVPEPTSLLLAALGLVAGVAVRRRRVV